MTSSMREREDCRLCGSRGLERVLTLPATPLANEFPHVAEGARPHRPQDEFPLWLASCPSCRHVQLPVVVDPSRLFRDYVYVSGTSPVFVEHFKRYADEQLAALSPGDLVVEVGSNDGTLLRFFQNAGMRVLGVDPARDIARRASDTGIETWPMFFDDRVAATIVDARGTAKLVVANNVFAHADDLAGFARAVKDILAPDGRFVFEVSYLPDVIEHTLFDTIYHEHLSYHAIEPLVPFFARLGMTLVHAQRVDTHGGSVRVTVVPTPNATMSITAADLIMHERAMGLASSPYRAFDDLAKRIAKRSLELSEAIATYAGKGTVAGYGAPAKATTLLRTFGLERRLDFVVDDSPHKQGRYMPGGKIPVMPSSAIGDIQPSVVVVLAWNFADSIINKLGAYRAAGGNVIVPLPVVRTIH